MATTIPCTFCDEPLENGSIFKHVESQHIGYRYKGVLYYLNCGDCPFQACELSGETMIDHCFKRGHSASAVTTDWQISIEQETHRTVNIISYGVKILEGKKPTGPKDSRPEARHSGILETANPTPVINRIALSEEEIEFSPILQNADHRPVVNHTVQSKDGFEFSPILPKSDPTLVLNCTYEEGIEDSPEPKLENNKINFSSDDSASDMDDSVADEKSSESFPANDEEPEALSIFDERFKVEEMQNEATKTDTGAIEYPDSSDQKKASVTGVKVIECKICPFKRTLTAKKMGRKQSVRNKMINHGLSHTKDRLFHCEKCGRWRFTKSKSRIHDRICEGELKSLITPEKLAAVVASIERCFPNIDMRDELGKIQFNGIDFSKHFGIEKKPYRPRALTCVKCEKTFSGPCRNKNAVTHVRYRMKFSIFQCTTCGTKFMTTFSALKHQQRQIGKEFQCTGELLFLRTDQYPKQLHKAVTEHFPNMNWDSILERGSYVVMD